MGSVELALSARLCRCPGSFVCSNLTDEPLSALTRVLRAPYLAGRRAFIRPWRMLSLRVLGTIDLRDGENRPVDAVLAQPKRLALLIYLALARPYGFQRRDVLVALLWPELDQSRARNALSQALHHLRRSLGADVVQARGDEEVALSDTSLASDVRQLVMAIEQDRADVVESLYGESSFQDSSSRPRENSSAGSTTSGGG